MAKNIGRKFATMDEEERRRFDQEAGDGSETTPGELDFEDPRQEPGGVGEDRDGTSALLDDEAHRRAVERQRKGRT
jgi:hypothetical protein